jgi:hypothetical protein
MLALVCFVCLVGSSAYYLCCGLFVVLYLFGGALLLGVAHLWVAIVRVIHVHAIIFRLFTSSSRCLACVLD